MQHVNKYCHEKFTKKYHKKHFTNKILRYMSSCFEASQSMPPPVTRLNLCCTVYLTLWKWDSERVGEEHREWGTKKETPEAGGLTRSICFCFCLAQGQLGAVAKCQQTFECRLSLTCPPSCPATRLSLSCSLFLSLSVRAIWCVTWAELCDWQRGSVCESPKKPVRIIAHWGQLEARAWLALVAV